MATETIAEGYVYLHDGSTSGGTITYTTYCTKIRAEKIERDITKELKVILFPQTDAGSEPSTKLIDFQRVKCIITVYGYLADISGGATRFTQRDNLIELGDTQGTKEIVWGLSGTSGEQKEIVGVDKIKITEDAKDPKRINIIMTLIKGEDLLVQS